MPQCCRCNGNGRCKACICTRSGKPCTDCTPSHVGRCENRGGAAGVGGAKPDDWGPNRATISDDTPALVNGPMKSHGQSTEREMMGRFMKCLSLTTEHMARNPRLMWCSSMTTKHQAWYQSRLRVQIIMRTRGHYPLARNPIFSGDPKMEKLFAI